MNMFLTVKLMNWIKEGYSQIGLPLQQFGLHEVAQYWQQVVDMNQYQKKTLTMRIIHTLFNTVTNKKMSVFGLAFKKDTGNVRETPSLTVCRMLMEDGAIDHVYDRKVTREAALKNSPCTASKSTSGSWCGHCLLKKASRTPTPSPYPLSGTSSSLTATRSSMASG